MSDKTLKKILLAISWLSLHGMKVNKKRVQRYTGLSWLTVHRYFEDVLPSMFLLEDIQRFDQSYTVKPIERRLKVCNQKSYLFL